jgi:superfamily II DNA or RNA helicase
MEGKFALVLSHHRTLGYLFQPVVLHRVPGKEFHTVGERISMARLDQYEPIVDQERRELVRITEEYSDNQLLKVFVKKRTSIQEFYASVSPDLYSRQLRPYLERRIIRCLEWLTGSDIPVYQKKQLTNVYDSDRILLTEENASVVFHFNRTSEGIKYYLTLRSGEEELNLTGKGAILLTHEPCTIIMGNRLYRFDDIDGKKLIPFFEKPYLLIPANAERKYFETFVKNSIRHYTVKAQGFQIQDLQGVPIPLLSLDKNFSGNAVLTLSFRYDEKTVFEANKKTEQKVVYTESNGEVIFTRLVRNHVTENHIISALLKMGLVNRSESWFIPLEANRQSGPELQYALINWLNFHCTELQQLGVVIKQEPSSGVYYLNKLDLQVQINESETDWFDLKAVIRLDTLEIPFVRFRQHILEGRREFVLPDGRLIILPMEWFARFRNLISFSTAENDLLKLGKQHLSLLEDSLKQYSGVLAGKIKKLLDPDHIEYHPVPEGIRARLREYQQAGYQWMLHLHHQSLGGCLADDMGLGKTLQALTLMQQVMDKGKQNQTLANAKPGDLQLSLFSNTGSQTGKSVPSLVIVPTSLVHNWLNEIAKFAPGIRAGFYGGPNRRDFRFYYDSLDLVIASYGIVRNDFEELEKLDFLYIVLDEGQVIKNPRSKIYKAIIRLRAAHRLVLTGTPIENSLTDLWAQMNFLNPGLLGTYEFFRNEFMVPIEKEKNEHSQNALKTIISPFLLRRTKKEVAPELPDVMEQLIWCDMPEDQSSFYETEKSKVRNLILENIRTVGMEKSSILILQSLTRLRQIASHPALVEVTYESGSGKYQAILDNLHNLLAEGHKALVFSSFVKHLNLFTTYCDAAGISYELLTGETRNRQEVLESFQQSDQTRVFFISLKAGGFGLNLTAADYVFLLDPWWNPAVEEQAISRAHRIGQDKKVFVYRFISKDTIEEKILRLQEKKSKLAEILVNGSISLKDVTAEQILEFLS